MAHPPDGGLVDFHDHGSAPSAADNLQRSEPQLSARGTLHGAFSFSKKVRTSKHLVRILRILRRLYSVFRSFFVRANVHDIVSRSRTD